MKKYVIQFNDRTYEVKMGEANAETDQLVAEARAKGTLGLSLSAATAPVPNAPLAPAATATPVPTISGGEAVEAPMPGNIVAIHVKVGDVVKKGQLLLVLEAMKMENEIVSPVSGTVTAVGVTKGAVVDVSELLVQIA